MVGLMSTIKRQSIALYSISPPSSLTVLFLYCIFEKPWAQMSQWIHRDNPLLLRRGSVHRIYRTLCGPQPEGLLGYRPNRGRHGTA